MPLPARRVAERRRVTPGGADYFDGSRLEAVPRSRRNLPPRRLHLSATLLWDIVADSSDASFAQGKVDGQAVSGTAEASGASPCWSEGSSNYSYKADVTKFVTGNGGYSLTGFATGEDDGADPWQVGTTSPLLEGASLVVVYQLASMPSTVVQIAGGANEIGDETGTAQLTGFTVGTQAKATTTYIVADGQELGAKSATFDGTTVPDAGFTGSDPQAVPRYSQGNLWDTTTADVSSSVKPGDTSAALSITSATAGGYYDCVVWVGQVLAVSRATVGIYSPFKTSDRVTEALDNGWTALSSVSGAANKKNARHDAAYHQCQSPWVGSTGADTAVETGISEYQKNNPGSNISWLVSYWTPAIPPYSNDNTSALMDAGYAAGVHAAQDVARAQQIGHVLPTYIALDFEPSPETLSCGSDVRPNQKEEKPGDKQCWDWPGSTLSKNCFVASRDDWEAFALGWAHGVSTGVEDLPVAAAIYVNQSEYNQEGIASFGLPVILAEGLPGPAAPLKGLPIVGYAAFYSACQNVPANISKVQSWGGMVDTIQLAGSRVELHA